MGNQCNKPEDLQQSGNPTVVYWKLHGRGDFCQAMLYAGGTTYDLDDATANAWPSTKEISPFGQLPYLKHGDLVLGQGGAINRYCARIAGIYPDDPVEASICDMYIEQVMDLFSELFKVRNNFASYKITCHISYYIMVVP
jgi:glutathione S-transferase